MANIPRRLRPRSPCCTLGNFVGLSLSPTRTFSKCGANLQETTTTSPSGETVPLVRRHNVSKAEPFYETHRSLDNFQPRWIKKVTPEEDRAQNHKRDSLQPRQRKSTRNLESLRAPSSAKVDVEIDGETRQFSSLLLRDLCQCHSCVDQSTKQKLFSTADIPSTIRPRQMHNHEDLVTIRWRDDITGYGDEHITKLPKEVLRSFQSSGTSLSAFQQSLGPKTLWQAEDFNQMSDIDYDAYMQDDAVLYKALQQMHKYGLLFLSNVPESEKSVSTIAERIGPVKNTFYGYTWDVRSVPEAKNVAYTSQDLGFHMDLLYMKQPPHLQFLHCIRSSSVGGASLFTDSYKSASDLFESDLEAFFNLARIKATFHYNHPNSHLYKQLWPVFDMLPFDSNGKSRLRRLRELHRRGKGTDRGNVDSIFGPGESISDYIDSVSWSPPFQGPFQIPEYPPHDASLASPLDRLNDNVDTWHKAAREFSRLIHRPEAIYERLMKPGECVLFDNRRVLHARRAFDVGDAGKERWLRGAYLDKDPYLSKLRVLQDRFQKEEVVEEQRPEINEEFFKAAAAS